MSRRVSDHEISEHVERLQHERLDARRESPDWRLVEADDPFGGMVWMHVEGEG